MREPVPVAFVMPLDEGYWRRVVAGLIDVATANRWEVRLYAPVPELPRLWREQEPRICFVSEVAWEHLPRRIWRGRHTVVVGGGVSHGTASVAFDDFEGGRMAATHLMDRGLRSLGCFTFPKHPWAERRARGFREAAAAAGCAYQGYEPREEFEERACAAWLRSLPKPAGVMACCDAWGRLISDSCSRLRIAVPEEVAIVGIDNDEVQCELTSPPMSSVIIPAVSLGDTAARLAAELLAKGEAARRTVVVPPAGVAVRASTDTMAIGDREVAAAVRYIADHAAEGATVREVLQHVPADRRTLERRFRLHVGRTMLAEIRRVRIEQAKRLLVVSDLPVADIAERCGFSGPTHLGVAFRQELGVTATTYRRRFRLR